MRPARENVENVGRTYFVTSQTAQRRPLFRTDRWALLLQDVLYSYSSASYNLHAYVIMPDHFHALLSPLESLERAVQKIKGGFSFRAKRELGWNGEIWQPGFSDHRIRDWEDWKKHLEYIRQNPVKAGLCFDPADYEYLKFEIAAIPQRLKPSLEDRSNGGAEAPPLHNAEHLPAQMPFDTQYSAGQTDRRIGFSSLNKEDPGWTKNIQAVEGDEL